MNTVTLPSARVAANGGDPATAAVIAVHNPADGAVVGEVRDQPTTEIVDTIERLRAAQTDWDAAGVAERKRWLDRYRDWLMDNAHRLASVLQSETAKPRAEAVLEVPYAADVINYYGKHANQFLADETPGPHNALIWNKRQRLVYRPHPVVGVITPWNFPIALSMVDALPALLAGTAVIVKPSEVTPLAVREAIAGWDAIGAPPVLACVTGAAATGQAIVEHVDYIQFTGSTKTGRKIAQRAADRLVPCGLELGGKDAMIVLSDADLDRAAAGAVWGAMLNCGQMCTSVERVYVEAPVYDEFVARVVRRVEALRQGKDDEHYRYDIGALANQTQLAIVERHVKDALAKGAKALTGAKRGAGGSFYEPTVLVDVDHSMKCMREETFGPTMPIMKAADEDEAIRLANDTSYGLSATVYTRDRTRGERVARQLEAGAVNVNDHMTNLFALPLQQGGWKQSGLGARNGPYGIRKYCRAQAITETRLVFAKEPLWYPYGPLQGLVTGALVRLMSNRGLRRRLGI